MPKTADMRESKFLKKEDVGKGALLTITGVSRLNVAKEGVDPELKWAMSFKETDKPLVLNATNIQICEHIYGSDDTDHWLGKALVLYTDPNVTFGGKLVGGIRVRAPKPGSVKVAPPPPMPTESEFEEDVPF